MKPGGVVLWESFSVWKNWVLVVTVFKCNDSKRVLLFCSSGGGEELTPEDQSD